MIDIDDDQIAPSRHLHFDLDAEFCPIDADAFLPVGTARGPSRPSSTAFETTVEQAPQRLAAIGMLPLFQSYLQSADNLADFVDELLKTKASDSRLGSSKGVFLDFHAALPSSADDDRKVRRDRCECPRQRWWRLTAASKEVSRLQPFYDRSNVGDFRAYP